MKRKNGLKNILFMAAIVIGGALFSTQILDFVAKIPVLGDLVAKMRTSTNA